MAGDDPAYTTDLVRGRGSAVLELTPGAGRVDPLLDALIGKLPRTGATWSTEQRTAWLQMMWMAFDVVYGKQSAGSSIDLPAFLMPKTEAPKADAPAAPAPKSAQPGKPPFYIDTAGHARRANGEAVMPAHVTDTLFDMRGEHGDLGAIVWADGSRGVRGLTVDIAAA